MTTLRQNATPTKRMTFASWNEFAFDGLVAKEKCDLTHVTRRPGTVDLNWSVDAECLHWHCSNRDKSIESTVHVQHSWQLLRIRMYACSRRELMQGGGIANRVWSSSELLSRFLHYNQTCRPVAGCRVMELGCGLGMSGIVAHNLCLGNVTLTDYNSMSLQWTEMCVAENCHNRLGGMSPHVPACDSTDREDTDHRGQERLPKQGTISCRTMDWNNLDALDAGQYDMVLASDTVHESVHASPFALAVAHCLREGGVCFMVNPVETHRYGMELLEEAMSSAGLRFQRIRIPSWFKNGIEEEVLDHDLIIMQK